MAISTNTARVHAADLDAGLRQYMTRVYGFMTAGLGFTAMVTALTAMTPALLGAIAGTPLKWVLLIAILGLGWFAPRIIQSGSLGAAQAAYWGYATLWGLIIAPMVVAYAAQFGPMILVRALLITTSVFAAMSIFGYVTKRNLGAFATFFVMATIGLLVAMVVNIFVQSDLFGFVISCAVVLLFSAITAWETQEIKNLYLESDGGTAQARKAIFGAFLLYGSFITLFIHILNILGFLNGDE